MSKEITGNPIGTIRKIDDLGRLVVPSEFRRSLGIEPHDEVQMIPYEKGIFIRKVEK